MKNMRSRKIASLMSEPDSNAGNRKLIRLIRTDNRKNSVVRFFCTMPVIWWG